MAAQPDPRRTFLIELLEAGLAAVAGRTRMRAALAGRDDLGGAWLLAVGKAASAMTLGALDALGAQVTRALVVSRTGYFDPELERDPRVRCIAAGHPLPDAASLAAGEAALGMARAAPPGQPVLLLVSGGASSLLECPPEGVGLEDLRRLGRWALASGLPIGQVNALRQRLSRVKAGRLAAAFAHCRVAGYYISDVPGDDPAVIGSGLLAAGPAAAAGGPLPAWLQGLLQHAAPPAAAVSLPLTCVGRLDDALDAIERRARERGLRVLRPPGRLEGDAVAAALDACARLASAPAGLLLRGGETTVVLPERTGRGGRNQHLALAAARAIAGRPDMLLLAAGTDGSDGNTGDTGALVDGATLERGRDGGCDAEECLATADSGRFLEASGDLVHTGPTGTNVGDLLLGLRCDLGHSMGGGRSM